MNDVNDTYDAQHRQRDAGFTIIEIIVAVLLLVIVVFGATAALGGSSRSMGVTKVRDKQTAIGNEVLAKLQADPTWAKVCAGTAPATTGAATSCNLTEWVATAMPGIATVREGNTPLTFQITANATGFDLAEDGIGADDQDSLRPDLYRVEVIVSATPQLASRFPNLRPVTLKGEMNPSIRANLGRVIIDVCKMVNQIDERMPVGSCSGGETRIRMQPPGALDTTSPATIASSCPANNHSLGGARRDCLAFRCADEGLVDMPGGEECAGQDGYTPPGERSAIAADLTSLIIQPVTGQITLENAQTGQRFGPLTLTNGRAEFRGLPVGQYNVIPNVTNAGRLWRSKSVPSSGIVTVEAGLASRAVLMYRPEATGQLSMEFFSMDTTRPWLPMERVPGWQELEGDGINRTEAEMRATPWEYFIDNWSFQDPVGPVEICLVPVPKGRLADEDMPCIEITERGAAITELTFENIEPGLYSAQFHFGDYDYFRTLEGTGGFMYVPPSGDVVPSMGATAPPVTFTNTRCNGAASYAMNEQGVVNPITGTIVQPCGLPPGEPPPGGFGGGGTQ